MKAFKERLGRILAGEPFEGALAKVLEMPPRRAVNPLFSFLFSRQEKIRWRAVTAMGALVAAQAEKDLEGARVVMRRLMWSLNDESGGIGWGSAEAMGEICSRSNRLAAEFGKILVAYITPGRSFIENEALQRGILWGLGRVAHAFPEHLPGAVSGLLPFLGHHDPTLRGLAAWAAAAFEDPRITPHLRTLSRDATPITLFLDARPIKMRIQDLVAPGMRV